MAPFKSLLLCFLLALALCAAAAPAPVHNEIALLSSDAGPAVALKSVSVRQNQVVDKTNQAIDQAQRVLGLSRPVIIGIAIGLVVLLLLVLCACCCCCCGMCRK